MHRKDFYYIQMTELKSNYLASFIGASIDISKICVLWEFGTKGSLRDVLNNDDVFLDDTFKFSFSNDVLNVSMMLFFSLSF